MEWNNKDPFFDRDLNNFRLLFELRVVEVGIIVTRCSHLQAIFDKLGKGDSYGNSTTHMDQLLKRIEGGGGGGCPILAFGISDKLYDETLTPDQAKAFAQQVKEEEKARKEQAKIEKAAKRERLKAERAAKKAQKEAEKAAKKKQKTKPTDTLL